MSRKVGLGRGLDAIFGGNAGAVTEPAEAKSENATANLDVNLIKANPFQPRRAFSEDKMLELAASVKEFGILQPLVVRKRGEEYQLVAGERRLRAAVMAGLASVPAIIKDYDDVKMMEIALVENIQRHDLNPIEEAQGLRRLMSECKLTHEQVAEKVGRSRTAVTNILRMLNLPETIQGYVITGKLNMGQAKQLLGLKEEVQLQVAQEIMDNGWSSRMVEQVVRLLKEGRKLKIAREIVEEQVPKEPPAKTRTVASKDLFARDFENRLVELLGTKVRVQPKLDAEGRQGGTIQIEYYSPEDLERIYEVLQQGHEQELPPRSRMRLHV